MEPHPNSTTIKNTASDLRSTIGLRHYNLRMAGHSDEEAGEIILTAVKSLIPGTASTPSS